MKIGIINGPNLNLLGVREPQVYGSETFEDFFALLEVAFENDDLEMVQSNIEGDLVNWIQAYGTTKDGIIINPGGYAHTSVAILDAIKSIKIPVVEVHISNVYARESFRHTLITASGCKGLISGLGLEGYKLAVNYLKASPAQGV